MAKVSIVPAVKKVVETIVEPVKIHLELTKEEATILFLQSLNTNGKINNGVYNELKNLGFKEKIQKEIGTLNVWQLERNLDEYVTVPEGLQ